jgi:hypothetical protein
VCSEKEKKKKWKNMLSWICWLQANCANVKAELEHSQCSCCGCFHRLLKMIYRIRTTLHSVLSFFFFFLSIFSSADKRKTGCNYLVFICVRLMNILGCGKRKKDFFYLPVLSPLTKQSCLMLIDCQ